MRLTIKVKKWNLGMNLLTKEWCSIVSRLNHTNPSLIPSNPRNKEFENEQIRTTRIFIFCVGCDDSPYVSY